MTKTLKVFCNIFQYLNSAEPDLASIIDDLCLRSSLNPKGGRGVTFLIPSKAVIKTLDKLTYSDNTDDHDKAVKLLKCHILTNFFKDHMDFQDVNKYVVNKAGLMVPSKVDKGKVLLQGGVEIKPDEKFKASGESLSVWSIKGGEISDAGEKFTKIAYEKMRSTAMSKAHADEKMPRSNNIFRRNEKVKGKHRGKATRGAGEHDSEEEQCNCREVIIEDLEKMFLEAMNNKSGFVDPFIKASMTLYFIAVKENLPCVEFLKRRVHPIPYVTVNEWLEPNKKQEVVNPLFPNKILSKYRELIISMDGSIQYADYLKFKNKLAEVVPIEAYHEIMERKRKILDHNNRALVVKDIEAAYADMCQRDPRGVGIKGPNYLQVCDELAFYISINFLNALNHLGIYVDLAESEADAKKYKTFYNPHLAMEDFRKLFDGVHSRACADYLLGRVVKSDVITRMSQLEFCSNVIAFIKSDHCLGINHKAYRHDDMSVHSTMDQIDNMGHSEPVCTDYIEQVALEKLASYTRDVQKDAMFDVASEYVRLIA